ncbi:MAG: sigma-70 family RNA polymerase sigma factor [Deltaproteobacteria bacterium]|nr:sigma-70 family RNA polymerase sigma factor [Deltaproteobacteria bacterium]
MAGARKRVRLNSPDEKLIQDHMPLVKIFARRFSRRLPPSVAHDDLLGAGALGLIDSVVRRRGNDENSFACYTRIRIRGAIFDELRSHDWLPRRSRTADRSNAEGEPHPVAVIHFEDLPPGADRTPADQSGGGDPLEELTRKRAASLLKQELCQLPERDRLVLHLHYFKGMRLKEIGRLLGVSEARISQIHHRALLQLRPKVKSAA